MSSILLGEEKERPVSIIEILLHIAKGCIFYIDQHGEVIVEIYRNGHPEYYPLRCSKFRNHLILEFFEFEKKTICKEILNNFLDLLEARAINENKRVITHNRSALQDGILFIDTGWSDWSVIEISSSGWTIRKNPPAIFRRYNHQQPLDDPVPLELDDALEVINEVWRTFPNCNDELLVTVWIIATLIPDHPHPILSIHGDPGALKSTLARFIQSLVDPSSTPLMKMPKFDGDMVIQISHRFLISYDNKDEVNSWQSDNLARTITGEGSSKRRLYKDEDEHLFSFIRRIMMTGINIAARKPDLLDRCLLILLQRLPKSKRKTDEEVQQILDELRPKVLGAILTILSEAFRYYRKIKLTELPRMADFAIWGEAISRVMGNEEGVFINAYWDNIGIQNIEALEANPVGLAILHLTRTNSPDSSGVFFNGSATELLDKLGSIADEELRISTKSKPWPKAPQALTRRINEIWVNLEEEGIEVRRERDSTSRAIIIRKKRSDGIDTESDDSVTKKHMLSSSLDDGNDDNDGVFSFRRKTPQEERIKLFEKELSSIFSHRPKISLLALGKHFGKYYQGDQRNAIKDFVRFVENGWLPFLHDNEWVYRE